MHWAPICKPFQTKSEIIQEVCCCFNKATVLVAHCSSTDCLLLRTQTLRNKHTVCHNFCILNIQTTLNDKCMIKFLSILEVLHKTKIVGAVPRITKTYSVTGVPYHPSKFYQKDKRDSPFSNQIRKNPFELNIPLNPKTHLFGNSSQTGRGKLQEIYT